MSGWDTKATCQMAHHWTGPAIASTIQRRLDQIHTLLDRHCHGPILPTRLATSRMEPHWMLQEMPWTILKPCSLTHMHRALRCPDLTTLLKLATWWMEPTCCEPATSLCKQGPHQHRFPRCLPLLLHLWQPQHQWQPALQAQPRLCTESHSATPCRRMPMLTMSSWMMWVSGILIFFSA